MQAFIPPDGCLVAPGLVLEVILSDFLLLGVLVLRKNSRYCYGYSLKRNQVPASRLHYFSLTAPPWSLHLLPFLFSNCLHLPFGIQGTSWRLNYSLKTRSGGAGNKSLVCPGAPQGTAWFHNEGNPPDVTLH